MSITEKDLYALYPEWAKRDAELIAEMSSRPPPNPETARRILAGLEHLSCLHSLGICHKR